MPKRCCHRREYRWGVKQCRRVAEIERGGLWYCKYHDPELLRLRRDTQKRLTAGRRAELKALREAAPIGAMETEAQRVKSDLANACIGAIWEICGRAYDATIAPRGDGRMEAAGILAICRRALREGGIMDKGNDWAAKDGGQDSGKDDGG